LTMAIPFREVGQLMEDILPDKPRRPS